MKTAHAMTTAHALRRTLAVVALTASGLLVTATGPAAANGPDCRSCTLGHDGIHHGGERAGHGNNSGSGGSGGFGGRGHGGNTGGHSSGPGSHR